MSALSFTGFGATTTAGEVIAGVDLTGRRAVVTGGASGIGVETARVLAAAGAEVTLAVRDLDQGRRTAAALTTHTGNTGSTGSASGTVSARTLDLSDLESVAEFVARWDGPLHILVNNAGVMALPERQRSHAGWEMQFAVNHLGHFALAHGLHQALTAAGDARIVSVSSNAHLLSPVVFDDINFTHRAYDPWLAYAQAKTANALFALAAATRWAGDGIRAYAVHPGAIATTNLARHLPAEVISALAADPSLTFKTLEQGAATSVLAATSDELRDVAGGYLEDCAPARPVEGTLLELAARRDGVAPHARDTDAAEQLWELSERAVRW